jgi:hypothetical protein
LNRARFNFALPFLAAIGSACGGGDDATPTDPPVHELREEWRFISNDSSPATSLTRMRGGAVLPDARLLTVHMEQESAVRVFDSAGRFVRLVGREGRGPGEFRQPGLVGLVGDTVWVFELGQLSYLLFDRRLEPIGQVRTDASTFNWFGVVAGTMTLAEADREKDSSPRVIALYDFSGRLVRPLAFDTLRDERFQFDLRIRNSVRNFSAPVISRAQLLVVPGGAEAVLLDPGGLTAEMPGRITMRRIAFPSGDVSAPVVVSLPPRRVTASDRDSMIARGTRSIRGFESDYRAAVRFPEFYPAFQWFDLIGLDGSLWLREFMDEDNRLVLSADGMPLMRVSLPKGLRVLAASRTHVWGTLSDPDDVPMVLRYRIVAAGQG